ncbi:MAG: DUF433 domain-containing protein [Phycisphaerales bacterium]|nr:DUF433 domain-containing protein [Phycisphaerales bacterium]
MLDTSSNPPCNSRELIPPDSPLARYVSVDPGRLGGEPCFAGTRVPIQVMFDYVTAGDTLDEFLAGFPNVTWERAVGVLELASRGLVGRA